MYQCYHVDGEFCDRCFPIDVRKSKDSITINLHITKVKTDYFVALDARTDELEKFGITNEDYNKIAEQIQQTINTVLLNKIGES